MQRLPLDDMAPNPMNPSANLERLRGDGRSLSSRLLAALMAGAGLLLAAGAGPTHAATTTASAAPALVPLIVRARASLAGGVGPLMQVWVGGRMVGSVQVRSTVFQDHSIVVPAVAAGARVDVVYTNDEVINGEDRNLHIAYVSQGGTVVLPSSPGSSYDRGIGAKAFDGLNVIAGQGEMNLSGALRLIWPAATVAGAATAARRHEASRLLQQGTFGPTRAEIDSLAASTPAAWIDRQMALPFTPDFLSYFQAKLDQGADFLPRGKSYTPMWNVQAFWRTAVTAPDQLRKRTAFALQQIFTVSLADTNLWFHGRPYAAYLDTLNRHAFGSYRQLLEEVALNPVTGMYLSHIRNQREDGSGRMPDENFAREVMQLFSIGLVELNVDGTPKLDAAGKAIETYGNADVMAMARVFTGWSWGFDDAQLSATNFRWGQADYATTGAARIDLRPMKNYPDYHSAQEKRLFAGKPWAVTIPAGTSGPESLRIALDTLFNHPNVGPFIGRQLIQRMVSSNPSPAYVQRVAQAFANNGKGVRGDMGAVVRAVLLDTEARPAVPGAATGKLREPVLRMAHFMRSFDARSESKDWLMAGELTELLERPLHASSVFGFFRPGYTPPNTSIASAGLVAPEMQIASESTVAAWLNKVESMVGGGLGWTGVAPDVVASLQYEISLAATGTGVLADHLNSLLLSGRMSERLRQSIVEAMATVRIDSPTRDRDRARVAVFLAMAAPEYMVQR